jgi:hypothetical protein
MLVDLRNGHSPHRDTEGRSLRQPNPPLDLSPRELTAKMLSA